MADLLEQNIKREKERKMHHMWRPKVEYESRGRTFIMIIITKMSMRPFFLRDDIDGSNPTWWAKWKCLNRYIVTFVYPCNLRIIVYANHFWTCQVLSCSDFSYSCNELLVNSYFDSPKESNRRSLLWLSGQWHLWDLAWNIQACLIFFWHLVILSAQSRQSFGASGTFCGRR